MWRRLATVAIATAAHAALFSAIAPLPWHASFLDRCGEGDVACPFALLERRVPFTRPPRDTGIILRETDDIICVDVDADSVSPTIDEER